MGYYTVHRLEILEGDDHITDYEKEISELADYSNCFDGEIKWYNRPEDMTTYSKVHPEVLFELSGEGEESGDLWIEYYLNGKVQRCQGKITFDEFDRTKLE